jgi:REP-associated tyrosine transposase
MARELRPQFPGAHYHISSRGNRKGTIFVDDGDRSVFFSVLARTVKRYGWQVLAYCLMGTHYHLFLETPEANVGAGMQQLNGLYARNFNERWALSGHVFQGRYDSRLVQREGHFLFLFRYLARNPVEARLAKHPADWIWSSYGATTGSAKAPPFLAVSRALGYLDESPERAVAYLRDLVESDGRLYRV